VLAPAQIHAKLRGRCSQFAWLDSPRRRASRSPRISAIMRLIVFVVAAVFVLSVPGADPQASPCRGSAI
jgi:hypothetical protein